MSGTRSASGLQCSHGSELDTKIPRPKMPKTALPPELRRSMGLKPRAENEEEDAVIWKAGAGVLAPTGSAPDGTFLRKGSGVSMSQRASALAQKEMVVRNRANIVRARIVDENGQVIVANQKDDPALRKRRSSGMSDIRKKCVSAV